MVSLRVASTLNGAQSIAATVPKNAFQKGSTTINAAKKLDTKLIKLKGKELDGLTVSLMESAKKWADAPSSPPDKKLRAGIIKAEIEAAKAVQAARDKAEKSKNPGDLDDLEKAYQDSIVAFKKRLTDRVNGLRSTLAMQEEMGESEESQQATKEKISAQFLSPEATRVAKSADALLQVQLRKSEQLAADLKAAVSAAEKTQTEEAVTKVRDLASKYRAVFTDHATLYQALPGQKRSPEVLQQEKLVDDILDTADLMLFNSKQLKLGPPPWAEDKEAEGNQLFEKGREIEAKNFLRTGKISRPSGGTSEVIVLKNGQDKTQFAFKSAKGESSMMGLPPGGGAMREAVTSKLMDAVLAQTGFDFGFPKATIATIEGKTGALIEGINGRELPAADKIKPDEVEEIAAFQNGVPGKELQKTVMAGLMTGNFLDLKWDNVFWEGEGANAKARPFDAGAAFLPSSAIKKVLHGTQENPGFAVPLLQDAEGKTAQGAAEPMDDELMNVMLGIDLVAMRKLIDEEVQRHAATGLDQCLDNESKENGLKCLEITQRILNARRDNPPSLVELIAAMQAEMLVAFPAT
jgi:hypothetical protein